MKTDKIAMRKKIVTILFFTGFFVLASGQDKNHIPDIISQKFLHYTRTVPREEVFVHTDRQSYISGENIWFRIYIQEKLTGKPSLNSHITYFELLNYDNQPIVRKKIQTIGGFGSGSLVLPDSLSSGTYTIKAYTGWMKNFPGNCFTGYISIYNAIHTDTYHDVIRNEKMITTDRAGGISLSAVPGADDSMQLILVTDSLYRALNNQKSYIFIHNRGNILFVDSMALNQDSVLINIQKSQINEGLNHITIFDLHSKPAYEGYFLKKEYHDKSLKLTATDSTGIREKISIQPPPGLLSVSVSPVDSHPAEGISEYFVHGSEFGIAGETISTITRDSLLQLTGNWIDWKKILNDKITAFPFDFEKEIHFLSGKIADRDIQQGIAGEVVLLCIPGQAASFLYSITDNEGNFFFPLPVDDQVRDIIIMPDRPAPNKILSINTGFADQPNASGSVLLLNHKMPEEMAKSSVNYQVQKIYGILNSTQLSTDTIAELRRFYGKPDQELVMSDYISLPTMEEVFFELLPHVSFRKRNSVFEIMITDRIDNKPYFSIPVLMIDGVIIKDPAMIIEMDPELVEKIEVIRGIHIVGEYTFRGIVNVITKSGDFRNVTLPGYMVKIPYRATDRDPVFSAPDYSQDAIKSSRIPDYRNTLYWHPDISLQKSIECWSADKAGDYQIIISGYSEDAGWISLRKIVTIR